MLDHIGLRVRDLAKSKAFYLAALAPLGYGIIAELGPEMKLGYVGVGFGIDRKPSFWIGAGEPNGPIHVALVARDRTAVGAFHAAALAAGGVDYGAFVLDPDGNNIEAVCQRAG